MGREERKGQSPSCLLPGVSSNGSISSVVLLPLAPQNLPSPTRQPLSVGNPTCSLLPYTAPYLHPLYPSRRAPSSPHQVTYIKSITSQISPPNVVKILQPFLQVRVKAKRWNLGLNHKGRLKPPVNAVSLPTPSTRLSTRSRWTSCTRHWPRS